MSTDAGGVSASNDGLGQPPEHAALCKAVNDTPALQSLLYDLNLLPEQTQHDPQRWRYTVAVVSHFDGALNAERERCIEAVEGNLAGSSYGLPPRIAALIVGRIRGA